MLSTSASNTSSQYLRPDYLSPIPTTLDVKRSPLALLAQTCNSIGKDISPCPQLNLRTSSVSFGSKDNGRSGAKDTPQKDQETTTKSEESPARSSSSRVEPSPGEKDQRTEKTAPPNGGPGGIPTTSTTSSGRPLSGDHHRHCDRSGSLGQKKLSPKEKCSSATGNHYYHHHHHHRSRRLTLTPLMEEKDAEKRAPLNHCKATSSNGVKVSLRPKSALHPPPPPSPSASPPRVSGELSRLKTASCSPSFTGECLTPIASGCLSQCFARQHLLSSIDSLSRVHSLPSLSSYLPYLQTLGRETSSCKDPFCTECSATMSLLHSSIASNLGLPYVGLPLRERPYSLGALDTPSVLHSRSVALYTPMFPPTIPPPNPWACSWVSSGGEYCNERCYSAEDLLVHTRTHWLSGRMRTVPCVSLSPHGFHCPPDFLGYSPRHTLGPSFGSIPLLRQAYWSQGAPHGNGLVTLGSSASRFHPYKSPILSRGLSSPTPLFELSPNQQTMGAASP